MFSLASTQASEDALDYAEPFEDTECEASHYVFDKFGVDANLTPLDKLFAMNDLGLSMAQAMQDGGSAF